jgi:hypothetical protein
MSPLFLFRADAWLGETSMRMTAQRTNAANESPAPRLRGVAKAPFLGNQAQLRRLQAKLTIGAVNDPLEHEADAVADIVMRMPDPALSMRAAPLQVSRKCAACEEEEKLRPKRAEGREAGGEAPESVGEVLRSQGTPLGPQIRGFFEPRFGADFSAVRVHDDSKAAASARSVGAEAYAVGSHLVFGAGRFQPGAGEGRKLIAHELAHTVQQDGANPLLRRAPCGQCAAASAGKPGIKGDPSSFGTDVEKLIEERRKQLDQAPAGSPDAILKARKGERAVHVENILNTHGIPLKPELFGFFVNPYLPGTVVGGVTNKCSEFPIPAPADKYCSEVPTDVEDKAKEVDIVGPLSADQSAALAGIIRIGVHEMRHATFGNVQEDKAKRTIGPKADCDLDHPIGDGYDVGYLLSEISAETAEFAPYFQNLANQPNAGSEALLRRERRIAFESKGENIRGAIQKMKCFCSCTTSDKFTSQTVKFTIASWPADQTLGISTGDDPHYSLGLPNDLHRK